MDKNEKMVNPIPLTGNDLTIQGMVLGFQNDSITYTSKKTGQQETLNRDVVILRCSFGIVICRFFNPSVDVKSLLAEGQNISLPVSEYRVDNGLKCATIRC